MSAIDLDSKSPVTTGDVEAAGPNQGTLRIKNLEFTTEYSGNGSVPSYQEISGAPVERNSPLGYNVGWFTIIFLNIGQMIGTGIFSTRMFFSNSPALVQCGYPERKRNSLLNIPFWDSGHHFDVFGVGRLELDILVPRSDHCGVGPCGVSGTGILFPKSIGCRSCLSGTSLPSPEILLSHGFRSLICPFVIQ